MVFCSICKQGFLRGFKNGKYLRLGTQGNHLSNDTCIEILNANNIFRLWSVDEIVYKPSSGNLAWTFNLRRLVIGIDRKLLLIHADVDRK